MNHVVISSDAERATERAQDWRHEDDVIRSWTRNGDMATVETMSGTGFGVLWPPSIPDGEKGDRIRLYGGMGFTTKGVDIWRDDAWQSVSYKTQVELDAEHEAWVKEYLERQHAEFERDKAKLDAAYEALPPPLKRRLDRFRAADPDFRWREEAYEMAACAEAGRLYRAAMDPAFGAALKAAGIKFPKDQSKPDFEWTENDGTTEWEDTPLNRLIAFDAINSKLNGYAYKRMHEFLPDMDDGHSGNTWGHAVWFAKLLIEKGDEAAL